MAATAEGKNVFIVMSSGPRTPERCSAPFFFGRQAALQGATVRICFILEGPLLLKPGVAETICPEEGGRPVSDSLARAVEAGVLLQACDAALRFCNMTPDDLREEVEDLVGPSYIITEGLAADLVLNF